MLVKIHIVVFRYLTLKSWYVEAKYNSLTLKMKEGFSSETLVPTYQTA